jgi:hypothetical protein
MDSFGIKKPPTFVLALDSNKTTSRKLSRTLKSKRRARSSKLITLARLGAQINFLLLLLVTAVGFVRESTDWLVALVFYCGMYGFGNVVEHSMIMRDHPSSQS